MANGRHQSNAEAAKNTIGIMTFWNCPNFGSFLQAYALRNVVEDMCPAYNVRQIAYSNKKHMDVYYSLIRPSAYKCWAIRVRFYLDAVRRICNRSQIVNLRKFKENYERLILHTPIFDKQGLQDVEFETVILGSDIIWDYSIPFFDRDPFLFGCGIHANHLISYATSFGTVKRGMNHPRYVTDAVKEMDAISVRDCNSSLIVKDIAEREAEIVLDPSLLWDFNRDPKIKVPDIGYKYVAVYGSYFTEDEIRGIKQYCEKHSLKIVFLDTGLDQCDWCDVFIDASTVTPFDWCGYIKGSEFLMTSTFHGFHFGLIFEKRIIFNATDFMRAKLTDFLMDLDLYDAMAVKSSFEEQMHWEWDYGRINSVLEEKKKRSLEFLRNNVVRRI